MDVGLIQQAVDCVRDGLEIAREHFSSHSSVAVHIPSAIAMIYKTSSYLNMPEWVELSRAFLMKWAPTCHSVAVWINLVDTMRPGAGRELPPDLARRGSPMPYSSDSAGPTSIESPPTLQSVPTEAIIRLEEPAQMEFSSPRRLASSDLEAWVAELAQNRAGSLGLSFEEDTQLFPAIPSSQEAQQWS